MRLESLKEAIPTALVWLKLSRSMLRWSVAVVSIAGVARATLLEGASLYPQCSPEQPGLVIEVDKLNLIGDTPGQTMLRTDCYITTPRFTLIVSKRAASMMTRDLNVQLKPELSSVLTDGYRNHALFLDPR